MILSFHLSSQVSIGLGFLLETTAILAFIRISSLIAKSNAKHRDSENFKTLFLNKSFNATMSWFLMKKQSDRVKSGLQHLPTSSVLRSVLDIGLLGQTQDILGHNRFYYFSSLANLSSSVFQKEHWHIGSFLEEKYRKDSIWKISLQWKIEEKVNRSLSWSQNTSVRILFFSENRRLKMYDSRRRLQL